MPRVVVAPKVEADPADPAWEKAARLASIPLCVGSDARDAALGTEVQLLWDERFLYVRFICADTATDAPFEGRDQPHYKADAVEVFLDAVGDGRQYTELEVSPKNQVFDALFTLTAEPRGDEHGKLLDEVRNRDLWSNAAWNFEGLRTATRVLREGEKTTGWIADIALPAGPVLRRFGLAKFQPMTLRAHLLRYRWTKPFSAVADPERRLIAMSWAPVLHGCPHISPGAMGVLKLMP